MMDGRDSGRPSWRGSAVGSPDPVFRRERNRWVPRSDFRSALIDTAKIVTSFTLAALASKRWQMP